MCKTEDREPFFVPLSILCYICDMITWCNIYFGSSVRRFYVHQNDLTSLCLTEAVAVNSGIIILLLLHSAI